MMKPEPSAMRLVCPPGFWGKRCRWPPGFCCSKKRRRNSSNGELGNPGDGADSGSSAIASASAFCETDMLTTAGDTFFTSGAKLCCWISATGEVNVGGTALETFDGLSAIVGFSAHTNGESANVAQRARPIAATRFRFSHGWGVQLFFSSTNWSSYEAGARSAWLDRRARVDRQTNGPAR